MIATSLHCRPAWLFASATLALAGVLADAAPATVRTAIPGFEDKASPPAPDYVEPSSWAARPGQDSPALRVPQGEASAATGAPVDVFFVYPTTFRSRETWNADVADAETNHWTDISVIARQASVFNACCRIFAPRYRQASLAAFASPADGQKAYNLAFGDILRAFDHYLAHDNGGRPFILAGHSQGALMIKRLLTERLQGTPAANRLVAAYIIGIGITQGDFTHELAGYAPCRSGEDTGCVLAWNSFLTGSDPSDYRKRVEDGYAALHDDASGGILCQNPITIGEAGRTATRGALPGEARDGTLQALVPDSVSARCEKGILIVDPQARLGLAPLPDGNMHYRDFSAYYADIRADALRRARAFGEKGREQP